MRLKDKKERKHKSANKRKKGKDTSRQGKPEEKKSKRSLEGKMFNREKIAGRSGSNCVKRKKNSAKNPQMGGKGRLIVQAHEGGEGKQGPIDPTK